MKIVNLKRSEWECYVDTPDSVIEIINDKFSQILESYTDPIYAQKSIYNFCNEYREWGFIDSECNQAATNVINQYYGSNIDRWAILSLS